MIYGLLSIIILDLYQQIQISIILPTSNPTMNTFHPPNYTPLILYLSFVLSETQFLINAQVYLPKCSINYFTFAYFVLTTLHLIYVVFSYAFFNKVEKAPTLQFYQYIILPVSVLIISIVSINDGLVSLKVTASILLAVMSLLIICKIMNFGSVTPQLAQISTIIRLIRVVKLNLMAVITLIVTNSLVIVSILSLLQILSIAIFLFKFTYQKCIYEYILLIGMYCGVVSSLQRIIQVLFDFPYFFLAEISSLYFYFGTDTFLQKFLQIKYINSIKKSSQNKQDDQVLAGFTFFNECIFDKQKSINLSSNSVDQASIHTYLLLQRSKNNQIKGENACDLESIFQMNEEDCKAIQNALFEAYISKFHQTDSFNCFQFMIEKALELNETNKALILYYGFIERRKMKISVLQQCKFYFLYEKIAKQIDQTQKDQSDINFIQFTDNLKQLKVQVQQCLRSQIKLIQFLTDKSKKAEMLADSRLLIRHKMKEQIRKRIKSCMGQRIYFSSNQFKYLYLLYQVSIQKRHLQLEQELQKHFLASQVQKLRFQSNQNSLVVLSGFSNGEVINSNQIFKNYFTVTNSFNKSNIAEYLPTEKQRMKHFTLMSQFVSFQINQSTNHADYQCYLAIEREIGSLKLKTIQNFTISARIYYENSKAFNYVCCLAPKENHNNIKRKILLTKIDCKSFISKGIQFLVVSSNKIEQLGQSMEICEIQVNYESHSTLLTHLLQQKNEEREKELVQNNKKAQDFLQEKAVGIQKKLMDLTNHFKYTLYNAIEIISILFLIILIFLFYSIIKMGVDNYSSSITNLLDPINQAELARNRVLLQQQILSFNTQTSYFSDNLCSSLGIQSIKSYTSAYLDIEIQSKTKQFLNFASKLHNHGIIDKDINSKSFTSLPFLNNFKPNITYRKYISFVRAYKYIWQDQLADSELDKSFYSQLFPSLMLNLTLDSSNSIGTFISVAQSQYIADLSAAISKYSSISFASISVLLMLVIVLRVIDNKTIVQYLQIVQCIPSQKLIERTKEIKSSLQQLQQLQTSRIESVQFQNSFTVQIISDKKDVQNIPVKQFTDWHIHATAPNDRIQSNQSLYEDQFEFIQKYGKKNQPILIFQSPFFKIIFYNKVYLLIMFAVLITIIVLSKSAFDLQSKRIDTLFLCKKATEQLNQIQQKVINIVAYNWLKVLSLYAVNTIDMTAANLMYQEAVQYLFSSDYHQKIRAAYSKDISDQILYGQICSFFRNKTACQTYRNNIFSSGLSILNPLIVKEQTQINDISNNPQYYIFNLCDKTWLLFEGIVPMTDNIAQYGFNLMQQRTSSPLVFCLIPIIVILVFTMVLIIVNQKMRHERQTIIRQQVFSIETVEKLYGVTEYKPFFNKIYYS